LAFANPGPGNNGSAHFPIWLGVFVFAAVPIVCVLVLFTRRGPAVGYVPRRWRSRLNDFYQRHGWDAPFDEAGKRRRGWW
jgi:hypothetical protein